MTPPVVVRISSSIGTRPAFPPSDAPDRQSGMSYSAFPGLHHASPQHLPLHPPYPYRSASFLSIYHNPIHTSVFFFFAVLGAIFLFQYIDFESDMSTSTTQMKRAITRREVIVESGSPTTTFIKRSLIFFISHHFPFPTHPNPISHPVFSAHPFSIWHFYNLRLFILISSYLYPLSASSPLHNHITQSPSPQLSCIYTQYLQYLQ